MVLGAIAGRDGEYNILGSFAKLPLSASYDNGVVDEDLLWYVLLGWLGGKLEAETEEKVKSVTHPHHLKLSDIICYCIQNPIDIVLHNHEQRVSSLEYMRFAYRGEVR